MTHTYALLDVSQTAYAEVRKKLVDAGYKHAFHSRGGRECIDMHGIALREDDFAEPPIAELAGKIPVVLYFDTREDAAEFADMVKDAMKSPVEIRIP